MSERRILVTGSRDWIDTPTLVYEISRYISEHQLVRVDALGLPMDFNGSEFTIVHGACPTGADALAEDYANTHWIVQEPHPADWKKWGKSAGPIRNAEMVSSNIDVVLAFITRCHRPDCKNKRPHGSHGASHCADIAEAAGIEVRRFTQEEGNP